MITSEKTIRKKGGVSQYADEYNERTKPYEGEFHPEKVDWESYDSEHRDENTIESHTCPDLVYYLHVHEGLTAGEIGDTLGISSPTARKKIRAVIPERGENSD